MQIAGANVLITGASGGIGQAVAQAVAHALDRAGTLEAVRLDTRLQEYGAVAHEFLIRAKVVVR